MKIKIYAVIIIVGILLLLRLALHIYISTREPNGFADIGPNFSTSSTLGPGTICIKAGGTWKTFKSSCADTCLSQRTQGLCEFGTTDSCDCGPEKCWNGTSCEKN